MGDSGSYEIYWELWDIVMVGVMVDSGSYEIYWELWDIVMIGSGSYGR